MTKAYRSAETGEYVTAEYAAEHPDTTVAEEVASAEVAADRKALYRVIYEHLYNNSASDITDAIIASGILRSVAEVEHDVRQREAEAIRSERDAFLQSPDLDPAWIAGWHAATDHHAHRVRHGGES